MISIILLWIATIIVAFFIGKRHKEKPKKEKMSIEEKTKLERTKKAFDELMTYDYDIALGGVKHE